MKDETSNKKFAFLCVGVIVSMIYCFCLTFGKIPDDNREIANLILGVLLGTCIKDAYNYLFGSTESSKAKDTTIAKAQDNITEALASVPPGTQQSSIQVTQTTTEATKPTP